MTQSKSDGLDREDASLLLGLSTTRSTASVTTAGRELDALIAEKVMGLLEVHARGAQWVTRSLELEALHGGRFFAPVRPYSTSIADAWLVHLAICDKLFSVRRRYFDALQRQTRQTEGNGVDTFLVAWPDVLAVLRHKFPEAICLAALKAVGA